MSITDYSHASVRGDFTLTMWPSRSSRRAQPGQWRKCFSLQRSQHCSFSAWTDTWDLHLCYTQSPGRWKSTLTPTRSCRPDVTDVGQRWWGMCALQPTGDLVIYTTILYFYKKWVSSCVYGALLIPIITLVQAQKSQNASLKHLCRKSLVKISKRINQINFPAMHLGSEKHHNHWQLW